MALTTEVAEDRSRLVALRDALRKTGHEILTLTEPIVGDVDSQTAFVLGQVVGVMARAEGLITLELERRIPHQYFMPMADRSGTSR